MYCKLLYALVAGNCNGIVCELHAAHVRQLDHGSSLGYVFCKVFIVFLILCIDFIHA